MEPSLGYTKPAARRWLSPPTILSDCNHRAVPNYGVSTLCGFTTMPFAEATQFRSYQIVFRHLSWCCLNYTTTGHDSVKQGYTKRGQSVHDFVKTKGVQSVANVCPILMVLLKLSVGRMLGECWVVLLLCRDSVGELSGFSYFLGDY
jgi:hypothetical protein